jgi:hypothetical protein
VLLAPGAAPPAEAQYPPACYSICSYQTPCDVDCMADPAEPYSATTCGNWGQCDAYCEPNWQAVSGTERRVGRRRRTSPWPFQGNCIDIIHYTLRDANGCYMDRTGCEEQSYHVSFPEKECQNFGVQRCY